MGVTSVFRGIPYDPTGLDGRRRPINHKLETRPLSPRDNRMDASQETIDSLSAEQIQALLDVRPGVLNDEDAAALRDFVDRIGGIENATMAVKLLGRIEEAA